ncbi:hypothetical protein B0H63DRAFT_466236 [Podospora didyma]|uniref:Uncharacterized protein n=1 Tax=Podospora didyma TaxID=330526 RepID=A0AAE0NZN2_9PEZI|nr:hypothetical protein B0H63DRAFT_466236 [Podospora didyma]
MESHPLFLSPALPTEVLWYIIHCCTFPTTLVVCSSRVEFLSSLAQDIQHCRDQRDPHEPPVDGTPKKREENWEATGHQHEDEGHRHLSPPQPPDAHKAARAAQLLAAPLYQVAIARHIRIVFIPTVSHLRAFLSVFSAEEDSKISAPPLTEVVHGPSQKAAAAPPLLLIYGFLHVHRDTSEWSVQGMSSTASVFVETAKRVAFQAVVVEPRTWEDDGGQVHAEEMLADMMPVLSGSSRRTGPDLEGSGWTGRTVDVRRVLGRWFRFQPGDWETPSVADFEH